MYEINPNPIAARNLEIPLLLDKILIESAVTLIKAEAQGNLLGKDYRDWDSEGCLTDGWTPFGRIRQAIEKTSARIFESRIHPQQIIDAETLESLNKCQFNKHTREAAIELHRNYRLIPENTDISIWTDGSLIRTGLGTGEKMILAGAASIVRITNWQQIDGIPEHPIKNALQIENAVSSQKLKQSPYKLDLIQ